MGRRKGEGLLFPTEMYGLIKENYHNHSQAWLVEQCQKICDEHNSDRKIGIWTVYAIAKRFDLRKDTKKTWHKGYISDEEFAYFLSILKGRTCKELSVLMTEYTGREITPCRIKSLKNNHHLSSGVDCRFKKGNVSHNKGKKMPPEIYERCKGTMFKPGSKPKNTKPLHCIHNNTKDGYWVIKVNEEKGAHNRVKRWIPLTHWVWMQEGRGEVPPGHNIVHLDGDKNNCSIENLELVTNQELVRINKYSSLVKGSVELKKTLILSARLKSMIFNRMRERKIVKNGQKTLHQGS